MLEFLIMGAYKETKHFPQSGPGVKILQFGNGASGFFGEVTAAELFTTSEIVAFSKLTTGTDVIANPVWLKFAYKGKFLFIPKLPIRTNVEWATLYEKGLVYGEDTVGPPLSPQTTYQFVIAKKNTSYLKIRLIHGDTINPSSMVSGSSDNVLSKDCEWNQLLYRVSAGLSSQYNATWASYTAAALGYNAPGTLCVEHSGATRALILTKGIVTADKVGAVGLIEGASWRPVLEVVDLENILLSPINIAPSRITQSASGLLAAENFSGTVISLGGAAYLLAPETILARPNLLTLLGSFSNSNVQGIYRGETILAKPDLLALLSGVSNSNAESVYRSEAMLAKPDALRVTSDVTYSVTP